MPPLPPRPGCQLKMPSESSLKEVHSSILEKEYDDETSASQTKLKENAARVAQIRSHAPFGNADALQVDFRKLLVEASGEKGLAVGKYRRARHMLRRAQDGHFEEMTKANEKHLRQKADTLIFENQVKLSAMTGKPTLSNPATRKLELARLELTEKTRIKTEADKAERLRKERAQQLRHQPKNWLPGEEIEREVELDEIADHVPTNAEVESSLSPIAKLLKPPDEGHKAVYRSYVRGELTVVGKGLSSLPLELSDTLSFQLGLTRIYMPRNGMIKLLNSKDGGHPMHCGGLMHVKNLDLSYNSLRELPININRLCQLTHVHLQRNSLAFLPDSFLELQQLRVLDLSHNNFSYLPQYFGNLTSLQNLNLEHNMLAELPPSFPRLTKLAYLNLSSNGLAYLSITPMLVEDRPRGKDGGDTDAWELVIDPMSKKKYYHNKITGESRKSLPATLQSMLKDARTGQLIPGTAAYNNQRTALAMKGIPEWSTVVDTNQGVIYYLNNVTGESQWEMPDAMDTLGNCASLVTLKLNENRLRSLPESLGHATSLKTIECKNNYLKSLPSHIGNLTNLTVLRLSNNEIAELPSSMSKLKSLYELNLTSNHVASLPGWIGDMTALRQLLLGNNSLQCLPYKLGYCYHLTELQVFNNPLTDPPYKMIEESSSRAVSSTLSSFERPAQDPGLAPPKPGQESQRPKKGELAPSDGMKRLLWYLRRQYLRVTQGPEPEVTPHIYGINDEKIEIGPLYDRRIKKLVEAAKISGQLNLIQNGTTCLPDSIHQLQGLKIINITGEKLSSIELEEDDDRGKAGELVSPLVFSEEMSSVHVLTVKRSHLQHLDFTLQYLTNLVQLQLSENKLVSLPTEIRKLKRLEILDLTMNHISTIPNEIGQLTSLRELRLDLNRIEELPVGICKLQSLQVLSASSNYLSEIPEGIGKLQKLRSLCMEKNDICRVPLGLGHLYLQHLKMSHNRLERLDPEFMLPCLHQTIETLLVNNNNLLDLPAAFDECPCLKLLNVEYNPMRSPPAELLQEDMLTIVQYCRIRSERVKEILQLLEEYGFETDSSHLTPNTFEAVTGESGFLSPEDLTEFDAAVDMFLNGKYYECPATAVDIVDKLDALRHERQYVFYNQLLQNLLKSLEDETSKPEGRRRFSPNVIRSDVHRPWGREGEEVQCYAVTLDALLRDTVPNRYCRQYRPSFYKLVCSQLPPSVIVYTPEMLKDAINDFESPYGAISMIEKVEFEEDEYVDEAGRERRKSPCILPSLVISCVIYTNTEARRRAEEEDRLYDSFSRMEGEISTYLATRQGERALKRQMGARRRRLAADLRLKETQKFNELEAQRLRQEEYDVVLERKAAFDRGKGFAEHQFKSMSQAADVIHEAETALTNAKATVEATQNEISKLQKLLRMRKRQQRAWCANSLKRKYCHREYQRVLTENRILARDRDWRRPWDGADGVAFEDWLAMVELREEQGLPPYEDMTAAPHEEKEDEDVGIEFEWDPVSQMHSDEDMNEAYRQYLTKCRASALLPPWDNNDKEDDPTQDDLRGQEENKEDEDLESGEDAED